MLFSVLSNCISFREVAGALQGLGGKVKHFQLKYIPRKITLINANLKRSYEVFAKVYQKLLLRYKLVLSDSGLNYMSINKIDIIDSTTISLFKKRVGRTLMDGKGKGCQGKYVNELATISAAAGVVWYSAARKHDHEFLKDLDLDKNRIALFDKGYNH